MAGRRDEANVKSRPSCGREKQGMALKGCQNSNRMEVSKQQVALEYSPDDGGRKGSPTAVEKRVRPTQGAAARGGKREVSSDNNFVRKVDGENGVAPSCWSLRTNQQPT